MLTNDAKPRRVPRCSSFSVAAAVKVAVLALCVSFSALADELPDLGESARAELSPQLERRIGERIMNEIRAREPNYVDDPEINDYLNRLGRRLVEVSDNPGGGFQFFAIRDSSVNAFAMFGGFIGVNTGTLLTAQSESELAGVMAHEIAHVTQNHLARQIASAKQSTIPSLIAMAVGILAARSNASVASAAITSVQAGVVQKQLAYTRDFEREADRMGYQTLERAGFDVHGMGDFFVRLQKANHLYENNAPVYLRSHPLTGERLSDMENRAHDAPYRQVLSSLDFHLVRAKLRAFSLAPGEAAAEFSRQLREKKSASPIASRYGLVVALLRAKNYAAAQREMDLLTAEKETSPLILGAAAEIRIGMGDFAGAQAVLAEAVQRFPQAKSLIYAYAEALFAGRQYAQALAFIEAQLFGNSGDFKLYGLQAKTYAALGKRLQQHRAQAEVYVLQGQLGAAVEQLKLAQNSPDGDFYAQSAVDARLRELRKQQAEEKKNKKGEGDW